ncbi:MAG TPA: hypothetical protein VG474_09395, partial [Solirubrobacteraceae bacterium]|nr:hypothetical protein [Solirubrobacteraceae bacterium]
MDRGGSAISEPAFAPKPLPRLPPPSRAPVRVASAGAAIALRLAETAMLLSASRTMDRLVRSRAWAVIVAFALIGIVAMQVSLLKLNAGIGRAVETVGTLERRNAALRGEISRLSSGDRIQALAGIRGFRMPEPADVTYLRAGSRHADGARAARRMQSPDPQIAGPAGSAVTNKTITPAPNGAGGAVAAAAAGAATAAPAGDAAGLPPADAAGA